MTIINTSIPNASGGVSHPLETYGIQPAAAYYGKKWPAYSGAIPESFSSANWTTEARGFPQQTFLGASIRSFSMNGGFGDSSSTLSVELINDEFNVSDRTKLGFGDDVYHSGSFDLFSPPMVGSPVFFKFGQNFATVDEAYIQVFDDIYDYDTGSYPDPSQKGTFNHISLDDGQYVSLSSGNTVMDYNNILKSSDRGRKHIVFGGILQSYTQNRGPGGNPLFSVNVVDPREILANTMLILNNYGGSIFAQNNLLNVYGFLEYNASTNTEDAIKKDLPDKSVLTKVVWSPSGDFYFTGDDCYYNKSGAKKTIMATSLPPRFPITGTGYSRRGPQGIPYYRVKQAVNALMGFQGALPKEYADKGFGGAINFRGFNYVVDFGSLPDLPDMYYLDFDQINLLDLALEICDIRSRELFVTLLPIIDHPACEFLNAYNKSVFNNNKPDPQKLIAGIIRLDSIDRSDQPSYGSVKKYIDDLYSRDILVSNQDIGYELSNIVTDKFVVGAQEIDMYYFSTNADRDELEITKKKNDSKTTDSKPKGYQWRLETSLEQQVLPYYGMLGKNAVTIPKGFGAYQQILLDTTGLNANGVGAYYVTTEMELRCAAVSYDRWKEFLKIYNDVYLESIEMDDAEEISNVEKAKAPSGDIPIIGISNHYMVTVPRSVFDTYALKDYGSDGLPYSACNPPYGYPLYYKRMTKLGIPEGGLTDLSSRYTTVLTNYAELKSTSQKNFKTVLNSQFSRLREIKESVGLSNFEKEYYDALESLISNSGVDNIEATTALIETSFSNNKEVFGIFPKISKKNTENAMKVYNFLKNIADECLGKKFLVKLPKKVNLAYDSNITLKRPENEEEEPKGSGPIEYASGPFGFPPLPISSNPAYRFSSEFAKEVQNDAKSAFGTTNKINMMKAFLGSGNNAAYSKYVGALEMNYNPVSEQYESNYIPTELGGFFEFDLLQNLLSKENINMMANSGWSYLPRGLQTCLIPKDLTNFINEQGRVSPYVRFDHSQHLSLESVAANDMTQQVIVGGAMIPDLCEYLDNVHNDEFHSFPDLTKDTQNVNTPDLPEQIAFVKCSLSDQLFMPPKSSKRGVTVHAEKVKDIGRRSIPAKVYIPEKCEYVDSFQYYKAHFIPLSGGQSTTSTKIIDFERTKNDVLQSYIINTEPEQLDTENVYALITLPSKIIPTKDARFRDGPFQQMNAERFKHFMTMDTVDVPEFDKPAIVTKPFPKNNDDYKDTLSDDQKLQSWIAAKKAIDSLNFAFPNRLNVTSPSPVYPNLVVLPLMSKDRCYGPWVSSQLDGQAIVYKNICGKVEFIKDENLSPWNYSGYQLMNEAGSLQAEFANSMLLFSERGGFTMPALPPGNFLCKALIEGGPLVTNIDVSIGEGGIQTTIKMDLYTASFGKLQKQKQDIIAKMGRERQRLRDERNALIRKGLGKAQSSINYGQVYSALASADPGATKNFANPLSNIVGSVREYENKTNSTQMGSKQMPIDGNFGEDESNKPNWSEITQNDYAIDVSMQENGQVGMAAQQFLTEDSLSRTYYNSASISLPDLYMPASKDAFHPNMPSKPLTFIPSKTQYYIDQDMAEVFDASDLTKYGD